MEGPVAEGKKIGEEGKFPSSPKRRRTARGKTARQDSKIPLNPEPPPEPPAPRFRPARSREESSSVQNWDARRYFKSGDFVVAHAVEKFDEPPKAVAVGGHYDIRASGERRSYAVEPKRQNARYGVLKRFAKRQRPPVNPRYFSSKRGFLGSSPPSSGGLAA